MINNELYYGTGRRKTSIARVFLKPGTGKITINQRQLNHYFDDLRKRIVLQPLEAVDARDRFDIKATVKGGGLTGQAGALQLGISRALLDYDQAKSDLEEDNVLGYRKILKSKGYLTRDARKVERKKPGKRKARKSVQYSKR